MSLPNQLGSGFNVVRALLKEIVIWSREVELYVNVLPSGSAKKRERLICWFVSSFHRKSETFCKRIGASFTQF